MPMVVPEIAAENQEDILSRSMRRETPLGEYLGAKVSRGFDWTITSQVGNERKILNAEEEAYGPAQYQGGFSDEVHMAESMAGVDLAETSRPALTEDEWKDSPWHRDGIAYDSAMSPVRARILAENYDNRRYRDSLIERSPSRVGRGVLGFGAELLGNLPDPVNLLPLGVAGKGLSWGKAILYGAAGNAAVTAGQDALVMPSLRKAGEDIGWEDAALDIVFGAGIGGLFGFAGKALHDYRVSSLRKRMALQDRDTLGRAMELSLDQAAAGDPVDVSKVLLGERERLAALYDHALAEPQDLNKAGGDVLSPPSEVDHPVRDTGQADVFAPPAGREDTPLPTPETMRPAEGRIATDWRPEPPETAVHEAEDVRQSLLQPEKHETGLADLDESLARVEDLRKEGRLTPGENDALALVEEQAARVDRYEEALLSVVECIGRN